MGRSIEAELWNVYEGLPVGEAALKLKALDLLIKMRLPLEKEQEERDPSLARALAKVNGKKEQK